MLDLTCILAPQTGKQNNKISNILAHWRAPKIGKICKIDQDGQDGQNLGPKERSSFRST